MFGEAMDLHKIINEQSRYKASHGGPSYELKPRLAAELDGMIDAAPFFARIGDAGQRLIRVLHSVPNLYDGVSRKHLEFYLGRAGATPQNVFGRFRYHAGHREHEAGIVVLRCATEKVTLWEGVAVRMIKMLQARGRLCVANVATSGAGRLPQSEESVIYLTWRVRERAAHVQPPTRADVKAVTADVVEATNGGVTMPTIDRVADLLSRPMLEQTDIDWAPRHDRHYEAA
jgi:hypothetical protein